MLKKKIFEMCRNKLIYVIMIFAVVMIGNNGYGQSFSVKGGIPHLPVYANTSSIISPVTGMMIFSTYHNMPMIYCGTDWCTLCTEESNVTTLGYFSVQGGIPYLPAKADVGESPTPAHGSMYYSTSSNSIMLYSGSGWKKVKELSAETYTTNADFTTDQNLDVIKLPIYSSDPVTTVTTGAFYLNSTSRKIRYYNNSNVWTNVSCSCVNFTTTHTAGLDGAPETLTNVTYNVVETDHGGTCLCWLAQNLGATSQATSLTDGTYAARGWFFQFNRYQGYYWNGSRYPSSWVTTISEDSNWLIGNDPCRLLLGGTWRIPTSTEWSGMVTNSSWSTGADMYNSILKLHLGGHLGPSSGTIGSNVGVYGPRWSGTQYSTTHSYFLENASSTVYVGYSNGDKRSGFTLRCVKNL